MQINCVGYVFLTIKLICVRLTANHVEETIITSWKTMFGFEEEHLFWITEWKQFCEELTDSGDMSFRCFVLI